MSDTTAATPHWRPRLHFTPPAWWMNDPNGLVWQGGRWHLFYQYHPHSRVWGPMHWGHASSTDLRTWQDHGVALAPTEAGMVFSGSAVFDAANTSGLGTPEAPPLVALYTLHDEAAAQAGQAAFQHQALAYSLDGGLQWQRLPGPPVLPNPGTPGTRDFRDPKLRWLPERQRWLMALAVGEHIAFYSAADLRHWVHESDFGAGLGAHDGVWECPDLFPLPTPEGERWVLLVSLVKGGPAGGSATQYFVGHFDGTHFHADDAGVRWIDHGPDNYAGITWAGVPDGRTVFVGWMNNWDYARDLPTAPWRGAMTLPRELHLRREAGGWRLCSTPARELQAGLGPVLWRMGDEAQGLKTAPPTAPPTALPTALHTALQTADGCAWITLQARAHESFTLSFDNTLGDALHVGFDADRAVFFIDRRNAGETAFHPSFAARHEVPRWATLETLTLTLVLDTSSVELFADEGCSVMTSQVFPRAPWGRLQCQGPVQGLRLQALG